VTEENESDRAAARVEAEGVFNAAAACGQVKEPYPGVPCTRTRGHGGDHRHESGDMGVAWTEDRPRLYVAGVISGDPRPFEEKRDAFYAGAAALSERGYDTVNPLEVGNHLCDRGDGCKATSGKVLAGGDQGAGHSWECYLRHDLIEALACDGVALLPNWHLSPGARLEFATLTAVGLPAKPIDEWPDLGLRRRVVDAASVLIEQGRSATVRRALEGVGAKRVENVADEDLPLFMDLLNHPGVRACPHGGHDAPEDGGVADFVESVEDDDEPVEVSREKEPTEPGWYAYTGGAQVMVFHLRETEGRRQWSAHLDNGSSDDCAWGYIEQALGVWDLVPMAPPVLDPPETLRRLVEQWGVESVRDAFESRWPEAPRLADTTAGGQIRIAMPSQTTMRGGTFVVTGNGLRFEADPADDDVKCRYCGRDIRWDEGVGTGMWLDVSGKADMAGYCPRSVGRAPGTPALHEPRSS
jgi:hypothetical protein